MRTALWPFPAWRMPVRGLWNANPPQVEKNPLWRIEKKPRGNADSDEKGNPHCG